MKLVKMKRKYYKNLEYMYEDLGLVKNNEVDPSKVKVNWDTYKKIKDSLINAMHLDIYTDRYIELQVEMYLLNLGPSIDECVPKDTLMLLEEEDEEN